MKPALLFYELTYWVRNPLWCLFVGGYTVFVWGTVLGTGGYFDTIPESSDVTSILNSPYSLTQISLLLSKFLLFLVGYVASWGIYRDYRYRIHALTYAFPMTKSTYLHGKLISSLLVLTLSCLIVFLGLEVGMRMLGPDHPQVGTLYLAGYVVAGGVYLLPNVLIMGLWVFTVVGLTRRGLAGFATLIGLILVQLMLARVGADYPQLLAVLDPFAQYAFELATQDWNLQMQHGASLPVNGEVILNRLFWLTLSVGIYRMFYLKFAFQPQAIFQLPQIKRSQASHSTVNRTIDYTTKIQFNFSIKAKLKITTALMRTELDRISRNGIFWVLAGGGVLLAGTTMLSVIQGGEVAFFPSTQLVLRAPLRMYSLLILVITFLLVGLLVHGDRRHCMDELVHATPIENWQLIAAKFGAISIVQILCLVLFILLGCSIQLFLGFEQFQIGHYLIRVFGLTFPFLIAWTMTSFFVFTWIPNLFLGLFMLGSLWVGAEGVEQLGIHTVLLRINRTPALTYSDFYGFGPLLKGYVWVGGYWLLLGGMCLLGCLVGWKRAHVAHPMDQLNLLKARINPLILGTSGLFSLGFVLMAWHIYKAETAVHPVLYSSTNRHHILSKYQAKWEAYGQLPQPKLVNITLDIALFPAEAQFEAKGSYQMINDTPYPIDTIFMRTGFDERTTLDWEAPISLVYEDTLMKSQLYVLHTSLKPSDTLTLAFTIENTPNAPFTRNSNVLTNGTMLKHDILPRLGYRWIKHELPLTDSLVHQVNYFHRDADKVHLHTQISTSADQVALAPGNLIDHHVHDDRAYFEYQTTHPVKLNFSFHSARFEVVKDTFQETAIEVYHAVGHNRNLPSILAGIKAGLAYNTQYFDSFPHKQVRIIEIPHTEDPNLGTLTTNNIVISERLCQVNPKGRKIPLNLPFYVVAHELTHEWFGNQVLPADAEGSRMLTESITEYLSLEIYRRHFGQAMADSFLVIQQQRYDRGRKKAGRVPPLYKVLSHQEYLSYGKGTLAFEALAKAIGEEEVNRVLRIYLNRYRKQSHHYPTSIDLIELLFEEVATDHHLLIEQWFMTPN